MWGGSTDRFRNVINSKLVVVIGSITRFHRALKSLRSPPSPGSPRPVHWSRAPPALPDSLQAGRPFRSVCCPALRRSKSLTPPIPLRSIRCLTSNRGRAGRARTMAQATSPPTRPARPAPPSPSSALRPLVRLPSPPRRRCKTLLITVNVRFINLDSFLRSRMEPPADTVRTVRTGTVRVKFGMETAGALESTRGGTQRGSQLRPVGAGRRTRNTSRHLISTRRFAEPRTPLSIR